MQIEYTESGLSLVLNTAAELLVVMNKMHRHSEYESELDCYLEDSGIEKDFHNTQFKSFGDSVICEIIIYPIHNIPIFVNWLNM